MNELTSIFDECDVDDPQTQWLGVEVECFPLFSNGGNTTQIVDFIRENYETIDFAGKGLGVFAKLDGHWVKCAADSPACGDEVFEIALLESSPGTAAYLAGRVVPRFLARLEKQLEEYGIEVKFVLCSACNGRRSAWQVSLSRQEDGCPLTMYQSLTPLIASLTSVFGPGGVTNEGYRRSPRASIWTKRFLSFEMRDWPIIYPKRKDYLSRTHIALDHLRSPVAIDIVVGILAACHLAYRLEPERFVARMPNPTQAMKQLSNSLDNTVRVEICEGSSRSTFRTGIEIQAHYLRLVTAILGEYRMPAWVGQLLVAWETVLTDVADNVDSLGSDYQLKQSLIQSMLAKSGLTLACPETEAAVAIVSRLICAGVDCDELFSCPNGIPIVLREPSSLDLLKIVNWKELCEWYHLSFRDWFRFEFSHSRTMGEDSWLDRLLQDHPCQVYEDHDFELAPRAKTRIQLFEKYKRDPNVCANWLSVGTRDGKFRLGDHPADGSQYRVSAFSPPHNSLRYALE